MKNVMKRAIATVLFIYLFIYCGKLWRYLLTDDVDSYTRIMMHQLYTSEKNIDVVFVGSSHVYRSLVPEITDKGFESYTFNAGTSAQQMDGSLALIREIEKNNDIKHAYVELYYGVAEIGKRIDRVELTATYIISDYMKPSLNKVNYLLKASSKQYWINSFIVARRNWQKIFDLNYIKDILIRKSCDTYKNYEYYRSEGSVQYYVDRGFVAWDDTIGKDYFLKNEESINGVRKDYDSLKDTDWEKSIQEIVSFCDTKGIELTFFIAPMPEGTLVATGDYSTYHKAIEEISNEYGIKFYDFNLCRDEIFDTNNRQLFKDEDHLNTDGAEEFSRVFCDFFMGKYTVVEAFYSSFEEKIENRDIAFYGIVTHTSVENPEIKNCRIVSKTVLPYQYKIIAIPKDEESRVIQEFSSNLEFDLPTDERGQLVIMWKNISDEEIQTIKCTY